MWSYYQIFGQALFQNFPNKALVDLGLTTTFDESFFAIDQSLIVNGQVEVKHLVDLVKAVYATGIDVNPTFDVAFVNNLINQVVIANESLSRIHFKRRNDLLICW